MRTSIQDKIKSDFSKYLNRLVELNDSTVDKSAFNSVQGHGWCPGQTNTFHPSLLINMQFKLSRFYWNLGLLENALRELDQLDAFLSGLIWDLSLETTAKDLHQPFQWLKQIKLLPFGNQCSLLGAAIHLNSTTDQMSLVEWRCFILAQQVLLTFHMFHQRLDLIEEQQERDGHQQAAKNDEAKEGISDLVQPLRSNFVTFILRYTHDCLMRITEEVIVLKANYSPSLLYMLSLVWHAEVFRVCDYLVEDVLQVETASYYICQMTYLHCNAVVELVPFLSSATLNHNDYTIARRWLECTPTSNWKSTVLKCLPNCVEYCCWTLLTQPQ
uniref:Uncharacterized protein n=1 Tax=Ditylenchus dipsaci TaxID=166011 RepID=A0A915DT09_9BILA